MPSLSRRDLLASGLLAAPGAALTNLLPTTKPATVCFFTDAHLPGPDTHDRLPNDILHHQERVRHAFDKANSFRPDLFVFGGDNVFAVDQGNSEQNADTQFANWQAVIKEKVKVPHVSVIGNHDIWYPENQEPSDRKTKAIAAFGMKHRYFRHDALGWSFFLLDVFHPGKPTEVDPEQLGWLEAELARSTNPCCIVTHAPILSVSTQIEGGAIGGTKTLRELFLKHKNVRLALSGHNHCLDQCQYDRVTYLCGGAVSGAWWEGNYSHFPPAFLILKLEPNGSHSSQQIYWETQPDQPPAVHPIKPGENLPNPVISTVAERSRPQDIDI